MLDLMNTNTRIRTLNTNTRIHTLNTITRIRTLNKNTRIHALNTNTRVHTLNTNTRIHTLHTITQIHTYGYISMYPGIYTHTCISVQTYAHLHTYTHMSIAHTCNFWPAKSSVSMSRQPLFSNKAETNLAYFALSAHMCVWIYMYINICVYMYDMCVCGYLYVCVYWCTITSICNVYIYKNTYRCIDIHIYV